MVTVSANRGSARAAVDTATFLFTDIEGSTGLWEKEGARMAAALAQHDLRARAAVEGNRGIIVKTTGDGLFAAFPRELVLAIAGLALLTTIGNALAAALGDEDYREASAMTFFVTLSGITLLGVGAAFWGIVAGGIVLALRRKSV